MSVPAPSRDQQRRQRRLQHHEQARALAPRQRRKPAGAARHRARSATRPPRWLATAGRGRSAGSSSCSGSSASAAVQYASCRASALAAIVLLAQHRLLPQRVVGVLHRQRRQAPAATARAAAPGTAPPGRATAAPATSRRRRCGAAPAAARARSQPAELEQMRPQRQLARQIEAPPGRCRQRRRQARPRSTADHLAAARPRRRGRKDLLPRHPEPLREHRAQALVPLHQVAQRALQRRPVERARQPQRQRDHIGACQAAPAAAAPSSRSRNHSRRCA